MRVFAPLCLALLALVATGCASFRVETDYDPGFDFRAVRTWQWARVPGHAIENDPRLTNDLVHRRMRSALETVLAARGYAQVEDGADIAVAYHLGIEKKIDVTTLYYPSPIIRHSYVGTAEVQVREYERGTLLIDMLTANNERLVWRGTTQARLHESGTPQQRDERARRAAEAVLDRFPPSG
jgi:hypothetical protein